MVIYAILEADPGPNDGVWEQYIPRATHFYIGSTFRSYPEVPKRVIGLIGWQPITFSHDLWPTCAEATNWFSCAIVQRERLQAGGSWNGNDLEKGLEKIHWRGP